LILKLTVVPTLTLMSVAKPWMLGSPAPEMSHTLGSVPSSWFSQTMLLPVQPAGTAASASRPAKPVKVAHSKATVTAIARHAGAWAFVNAARLSGPRWREPMGVLGRDLPLGAGSPGNLS
jgi:hypothetical protein